MDMRVSQEEGVTVVALVGRLDTAGAREIEARFTAAIVPPGLPAVVDMSEVSFLTSLGIRVLLSTARTLSGKGARLALCGAIPLVREVMEVTSLDDIIPVVATKADALTLVRG